MVFDGTVPVWTEDAAHLAALLDHEDGFAQFRRLDGRSFACGAASDDDEIINAHGGSVFSDVCAATYRPDRGILGLKICKT